jgi:uncharacterized protein YjiS (DUF1127 family)
MKRRSSLIIGRTPLSAEAFERIVREARARRADALGRGIGIAIKAVFTAWRRCADAIEQGRRMRALASLDDRRLAAMGITRAMVPAVVLGWEIDDTGSPAEFPPVATDEDTVPAPDRAAA